MSAQPVTPFTHLIDLDARRAQRAEAVEADYEVRFGGETFTMMPPATWPIEFFDVLRDGDMRGALRLILDEDAFTLFMAQRPTVGDVNDLIDAVGAHSGVGGLGNSSGSSTS